jgi:hypothetical protein
MALELVMEHCDRKSSGRGPVGGRTVGGQVGAADGQGRRRAAGVELEGCDITFDCPNKYGKPDNGFKIHLRPSGKPYFGAETK